MFVDCNDFKVTSYIIFVLFLFDAITLRIYLVCC